MTDPASPVTVPPLVVDVGEAEARAVQEALMSGMLVQHSRVARFEELIAEMTTRRFAIAVSSGTAALALAMEALRLSGEQDTRAPATGTRQECIVPALTWPSPAHAAHQLGYEVRFCDVDEHTWNAGAREVEQASNASTAFAVVIDQFGNPASAPERFLSLPFPVIEDAACALGSRFSNGKPCGTLGPMSCFSFHPRKVFTTGEGGAVVTDDPQLAETLRTLRNHGQSTSGGTRRFVRAAGNYRLGEMAAAMGVAQLTRRNEILSGRARWAKIIRAELADKLVFQKAPEGASSNMQTLGALLQPGAREADKARFLKGCARKQVGVSALSVHVPSLGTVRSPEDQADTPIARDIATRGIALPLYRQLNEAQVEAIIGAVRGAL